MQKNANVAAVTCVVIVIVVAFTIAKPVFAYGVITHAALTDEIVDLFNLYYPKLALTVAEKELVKKGSIIEDDGLRFMHHFYDPVYNRGLWGNSSSKVWAEDTFSQAVLDPAYTQGSALASVSTGYFDSRTDYTWERAIYDYVWRDRERGLIALGSVLHLIEDASVPDHTRNDPHPPFLDTSPYEEWTHKFTPESWDGLASAIYSAGILYNPRHFSDLRGYFDSLAGYSNNNFFSKDTIFDEGYDKPVFDYIRKETLSDDKNYLFGYKRLLGDEYRLVAKSIDSEWFELAKNNDKTWFIIDNDKVILTDYWARLSKEAVLHGAGVVRLFFEEVEKERKSRELLAKNRTTLDKFYSAVAGWFGPSSHKATEGQAPLVEEIPEGALEIVTAETALSEISFSSKSESPVSSKSDFDDKKSDFIPTGDGEPTGSSPPEADSPPVGSESPVENGEVLGETFVPQPTPLPQILPYPGFGGGGPPPTESSPASSKSDFDEEKSDFIPAGDDVIPEAPADIIPPDVSLEIAECYDSLADGACLVTAATLSLSWNSTAEDLARFELNCFLGGELCADFNFASTTATSTIFTADGPGSYKFLLKAFDHPGNESNEISQTVEISSLPVVINEIAWAGTAASAADEWIELFNNTSYPIDLGGWVLATEDGAPYLPLSGAIFPRDYFLIERTDNETVSDIPADLILPFSGSGNSFGLSNSGEVLSLTRASTASNAATTTIDRVPLCGNSWCGGSSLGKKPSMERVDPALPGGVAASWNSHWDGIVANGKDKNGNPLAATPKKRNSRNYLISQSQFLSEDKTLLRSLSPYIIPDYSGGYTVKDGAVVTIEPGVVVKIQGESQMRFEGILDARGTEEEPIVFTSIFDDEYAGDTNGDATSTAPFAGSWKNILLFNDTATNTLEHVIFKYGGRWFNNMPGNHRALLSIDGAKAVVQNSVFNNSWAAGIVAIASDAVISDNVFSVGTTSPSGKNAGLIIAAGAPVVSDNTFSGNYIGLSAEFSAARVTANKFLNNDSYAAEGRRFFGSFEGNTGSGNGKDAIMLIGDIVKAGAGTTTLLANALPYAIPPGVFGIEVPAGSAVEIETGVKILGEHTARVDVKGNLEFKGTTPSDILLTSWNDSAPGEWGGIRVKPGGKVLGGGFTLRHGGRYQARCGSCAALEVDNGEAYLKNAVFEKNFQAGMRLEKNSTTTLSGVEFREHLEGMGGLPLGTLVILNSFASLQNVSFSGNTLAVFAAGDNDIQISDLSFSANTSTTSPEDLF